MLQRTVSYKSLLRILGACFLLSGLYLIVVVLTSQGNMHEIGSFIFEDPEMARNYLFCGGPFLGNPILPGNLNMFGPLTPGPLLWVSIGMVLLSITSRHVRVAYVCFQIALWLISLSVWFPIFFLFGSTNYDPGSFLPFWLVTLTFSLTLLALYKPVVHLLRKLCGPNGPAPIPQV